MLEKTSDYDNVIDLLKRGSFIPHNLIGAIENRRGVLYFDAASNSAWLTTPKFNYLHGNPDALFMHFQALPSGTYRFSGVYYPVIEPILKAYPMKWIEETERYLLLVELVEYTSPYHIVDIPLSEARGIDARYEYRDDSSYQKIVADIQRGPTAGLYLDGQLVSYALTHDDQSLGYMYTLPAYRQRGLAFDVAHALIKKMLARGKQVFVEIRRGNTASQKLAERLGLVRDAYCPWLAVEKVQRRRQ